MHLKANKRVNLAKCTHQICCRDGRILEHEKRSAGFQSFQQSITTGILPLISYTLNNSKIHYRFVFIGLNICNSYSKQMTMQAAVMSPQQLKETPNSSPALFICFIALNTIIIRFEAT